MGENGLRRYASVGGRVVGLGPIPVWLPRSGYGLTTGVFDKGYLRLASAQKPKSKQGGSGAAVSSSII